MQPGDVVERYRVEARVGRGAAAVVYRVRHVTLDTVHALKVLEAGSPEQVQRLVAEGRAQASLTHPNLIPVHDVLDVAGRPALLMPFVDGVDLGQRLAGGTLEAATAHALFRGIVAGVAAAHRLGWVHRDLKPANVLIDVGPEGLVPRVTDFGIATSLGRPSDLTADGQILGTPAYMAPEQLAGGQTVDPRGDVWALGVILYELICGARPFPGETPAQIRAAIAAGRAPASLIVPDLSPILDRALQGCLTVSAAARFPDAGVLAEVLDGGFWSPGGTGRVLGGFEILSEIGCGASGRVYRARQLGLDRVVALKVVPATSALAQARFLREVKALARVDHRHVVPVLAHGRSDDVLFVAMAYVPGVDLTRLATGSSEEIRIALGDEARSTPWRRVLARRFAEVARGLHALHQAGVVHRDVKPANLILSEAGGRIVVVDLGLALLEDASHPLTQPDVRILGTLRYMPPEQLQRNLLAVDLRADIYALGATLTELCTRQPFFDGDTEARLIHQVLNEDPSPPRQLDPSIGVDLDRVLRRATAKRADDRYADAAAFADDLQAIAEGRPVSVGPRGWVAEARDWVRGHPMAVAIVATIAATLLSGGFVAGCGGLVVGYGTRSTTKAYATSVPRHGGYAGSRWMSTYLRFGGAHVRVTTEGGLPVHLEERTGSGRLAGGYPIRDQVFDRGGRVVRVVHRDRASEAAFVESVSWRDEGDEVWATRRFATPDGAPIPDPRTGIWVVAERVDERGYAAERRHRAADGETPWPDHEGSYGQRVVRDRWGRVVAQTWLDASGAPTPNPEGIAILRFDWPDLPPWSFVEPDRRAFDAAGMPTADADGVHAEVWTRDLSWRVFTGFGGSTRRATLDATDDPTLDGDGIAVTWQRLTAFEGSTTGYLGVDGLPTPGPGGVFGTEVLPEGGETPGGRRYLGPDGAPFSHADGYASHRDGADGIRRFYGPDGDPVARGAAFAYRLGGGQLTCLDASDQPTSCASGWSRRERQTDTYGDRIAEAFFDPAGDPLVDPSTQAARIETPRDASGRLTEHRRLGTDGALIRSPGRPARDLHRYDLGGRLVSRTVVDAEGAPDLCADGYHQELRTLDPWGREIERRFVDLAGELVVPLDSSFARRVRVLDRFGREQERATYDAEDRPLVVDGCARVVTARHRGGRPRSVACFGEDGDPAPGLDGASRRVRTLDATGRLVGEVLTTPAGPVEIRITRDPQGREVGRDRFGDPSDPVVRTVTAHDLLGHRTEVETFDAVGARIGRVVYRYDPQHRVIEERHHGADDALDRIVATDFDPDGRGETLAHRDPSGAPRPAPAAADPEAPLGWSSRASRSGGGADDHDTWSGIDGSILATRIRRYDDRRRLVEVVWSGPGVPEGARPRTVTYDADGLPIAPGAAP